MSSPKAAPRAAAPDLAASLAALLSPARAQASRRNGAKSRGPKTPEGKAHSSRNALKHGLRAEKFEVVGDEDPQAFAALEAALLEELAPEGALQGLLARRIARAAWRLERAEQIETELFAHEMHGPFGEGDLGLALIRDGNGARAFDTLLRYRGTTLAELWRALRMLKGLQAEQAATVRAPDREPDLLPGPSGQPSGGGAVAAPVALAPPEPPAHGPTPIEPEARTNPGETASVAAAGEVVPTATLPEGPPARCEKPIEPEARGNPGEIAPAPAADAGTSRLHEGVGAHTARQKGVTHAPSMRRSCAVPASRSTNSA